MARKALIQIRRGLERDIGTLSANELGYCTDTQKLYIGTSSGNVLLVASQTSGDMLKSIYDTDNDGIVDGAESVPWSGVSGKPASFTPSSHTHDDRYYTETEIGSIMSNKANSTHTHVMTDITGLNTALEGKIDRAPLTWNTLKGV